MKDMLQRFNLENEAIVYIKACLSNSDKPLARYLLNLDLEGGKVITYLPDTSSPEARLNFKCGGIANSESTKTELIRFIYECLKSHEEGYTIFEDTLAKSTDKWLSNSKENFFTCKGSIYHFLNSKNNNKESINNLITEATNAYLIVGIITYIQNNLEIEIGREIPFNVLETFAKNTQYIVVSAYDGESELIWFRKNNNKNI
ncbi:hypothetical protein [Tolypothrix sp. VBCCA 56010]|uniref:hypothetical protein n=1 Tax=Tolypothrix sp. VBCCA 56010 TaxID=3137731 RepID=UPI003D7D7592